MNFFSIKLKPFPISRISKITISSSKSQQELDIIINSHLVFVIEILLHLKRSELEKLHYEGVLGNLIRISALDKFLLYDFLKVSGDRICPMDP